MGKEFYDLTNEELCDMMCGIPEYDDNDYYITNCSHNKDLTSYSYFKDKDIYCKTWQQAIVPLSKAKEYCHLTDDDIEEQFAIVKINTLSELEDLREQCGGSIVIERPYSFETFQLTKIIIYDGYLE